MALPLKVLNRLRLGREIAAPIAATQPNSLAAVFVEPIISANAEWTTDSVWPSTSEKRLTGRAPERFIEGYTISIKCALA